MSISTLNSVRDVEKKLQSFNMMMNVRGSLIPSFLIWKRSMAESYPKLINRLSMNGLKDLHIQKKDISKNCVQHVGVVNVCTSKDPKEGEVGIQPTNLLCSIKR